MNFCLTFDFWIALEDGRSKPLPYGNDIRFRREQAPPYIIKTDTARCPFLH